MIPRRYQLRKEAVAIVERGHPWIFRDQLSTAAQVFADGDWLRLVDGSNRVIGHGIFEAEGAIAIRVLRKGPDRPDAMWVRQKLTAALARRGLGPLRTAMPLLHLSPAELEELIHGEATGAPAVREAPNLAARSDGLRLVHGESDGLPAVVVDRFADTLVAQSYSRGADGIARFAASAIARELSIANVLLRPAHRRRTPAEPARVLAGADAPLHVARFTEDGVTFAVDVASGQKSGTYLDLRGLRRAIAQAPLTGARVLNLFAYSGMLGRAAEAAGATAITHVDSSQRALEFAAAHHALDRSHHTYVVADVFEWLPALDTAEMFDLVIVDPPSMTSNKAQVPAVLAGYRKLYKAAAPHVRPGGVLVAACCTSRVERTAFEKTVAEVLGSAFIRERSIPPEIDHPVGFPEADYLKILWWRRRSDA
jgi:23S rRNA (cytosine1962-C5)-methyltransferase